VGFGHHTICPQNIWHQQKLTRYRSKNIVEKATAHATHMESRNKVLTGHWKDQETMLNSNIEKLRAEIDTLNLERRNDDERINTLQNLGNQQATQLTTLQEQKDAIEAAFERYKKEQDDSLLAIKERARLQEATYDAALEEAKSLSDQLRWALQVKKNVEWAE
jgi:chromosome segregation ATPase